MAYNFKVWKKGAIGRKIDVDHAYGDQCVDVPDDNSQAIFKKPYGQTLGHGNAKDLFHTASPSYFKKVVNNPHDPNQIPPQNAYLCYGAFHGNPYGHISVADTMNRVGANQIEQNGFNPNGRCYETFRSYSAIPLIGWLIPKTSLVHKVVQKVKPKKPLKPFTYIVHQNDIVSAICRRFGIPVAWGSKNPFAAFKRLNPQIRDINKIFPGQVVRVK